MKEVTFLFGIHNHQPVGNFDWVLEKAYEDAYDPFLKALERHPGVRLAMHNSGILVDWFEKNHPDYLDRLGTLVKRGQVEVLTGGYYEPILPSISEEDGVGQITKLTKKLKDRLGASATGLWLAERVWEPSLPALLAKAGVRYVMVDDAHFLAAGNDPDSLWNYWLTEDGGKTVAVWPISKALRYLVPFEPAKKTIEFLKGVASGAGGRVALLADDGEKFGVWPDTKEQVFEKGWLEEFFTLIEANSSWLHMGLPGEELAKRPPAGRVYLPTASYSEMMEWALPTDVQRTFHKLVEKAKKSDEPEARFLRGGFWRNFLSRYPESNAMHKRVLDGRTRLSALALSDADHAKARDHQWKAECNCAYWHGVFGGLYLPHLRDGIYRNILAAETIMDKVENPDRGTRLVKSDADRDGHDEWRIGNGIIGGLIAPHRGGALAEFDYFPKQKNMSHGLTRRPEAYHDRLIALANGEEAEGEIKDGEAHPAPEPAPASAGAAADVPPSAGSMKSIHDRVEMKEPGLEKRLFFDWYRRESLLDHFLRSDTSIESFDRSDYGEMGDFIDHPYEAKEENTTGGRAVRLRRRGSVWIGGQEVPVTVEKKVTLEDKASLYKVDYEITQEGADPLTVWFGVELNFTMLAGRADDRYYTIDGKKPDQEPELAGIGEHSGVRAVELRDEWEGVAVSLGISRPAGLWRLPVETITQSEAGFERIYQSSCVMPHWKVTLKPGEAWRVTLEVGVKEEK